jgi:hypothetical protein
MPDKQDSNLTGLSFAEEASLKTLGGAPVWYPLEPNSYSDFGSTVNTVARNPLNPSRQRKKGTITGVEASGGFNQDMTFSNLTRLLQGFFFADAREKKTTKPISGAASIVITSVAGAAKTYSAAAGLNTFLPKSIVLVSGCTNSANNGLKNVTTAIATTLTVAEALVDEAAPPAAVKIETVGFGCIAAEASISMNGSLVRMNFVTTNPTTLGLRAGEWMFVGGDAANTYFTNNRGYGRISSIDATYIEFDKVSWIPQVEAGAGKTIQLYFGSFLQNESDPALIKRRSYQLERTLGNDGVGVQSQYLVGAVPNELTFNFPQEDKVTVDMSFAACDEEFRNGTVGVKTGTRVALVSETAFNTSSDFSRIKLGIADPLSASVTPLVGFLQDATITVTNNVSANKALGSVGAFEMTAGNFDVGGSVNGYFSMLSAVEAVRANSDATIDLIICAKNQGFAFDVPLITLGNGRLAVAADQPITIPLENNAAESKFNNTLSLTVFPYLPLAAH